MLGKQLGQRRAAGKSSTADTQRRIDSHPRFGRADDRPRILIRPVTFCRLVRVHPCQNLLNAQRRVVRRLLNRSDVKRLLEVMQQQPGNIETNVVGKTDSSAGLRSLPQRQARLIEFISQAAVVGAQGFEHLPNWLEGRLRQDVVGVVGLVDEDRNRSAPGTLT